MSAEKPPRNSQRRRAVAELRADDFRRLGLQLSEARVSVIRKATRQATAELATRESKRPLGVGSEAELARMVASAYRLLDPRRRNVISERIQLLRARPKPIRTSLLQVSDIEHGHEHRDLLSGTSTAEVDAAILEDDAADDQWMLEMLADLRTEPKRRLKLSQRQPVWRRLLRGLGRIGMRMWIAVGGVVVVAILGLASWLWFVGTRGVPDDSRLGSRAVAPGLSATNLGETSEVGERVGELEMDEPGAGELTTLSPAYGDRVTAPGAAQLSGIPGSSDDAEGAAVLLDELGLNNVPLAMPGIGNRRTGDNSSESLDGSADVFVDGADRKLSESLTEKSVPGSLSPDSSGVISGLGNASEAESLIVGEPAITDDSSKDLVDSEPSIELNLPESKFPLPDVKALEEARKLLEKDYPGLMRIARDDLDLLRSAWRQAEQFPAGSAAQFSLMQEVVHRAILLGFREAAYGLQLDLTGRYQLEPCQLDRMLLTNLVVQAVTISEQERVAYWILRALDRAVFHEDFKIGEELLLAGTRLATQLNDEGLRSRYRLRREQFTATTRIASRAKEILTTKKPDEVTAEDAALVARYLCLDRRQWTEGLPWMVMGRDARLSSLARDELTFGGNSDAKTIEEIAEKWIELGAGSRRIGSDAFLLHGRDLLGVAAGKAEGVKRLEIEKRLKEFTATLPEDLKPLVIPADPFSVQLADTTRSLAGGNLPASNNGQVTGFIPFDSIPDPLSLGVLGRLAVAGQDTGLVFQYPTHLPLRTESLEPLLRQRGFADGLQQFEFHGHLTLAEMTTVEVVADGVGPTTRIAVNGKPLAMAASAEMARRASAKVDLNAGLHRFVWQTSGAPLPSLRLVLRDDRTGEVVHLRHDEISRQVVERLPVISRIQIRPQ